MIAATGLLGEVEAAARSMLADCPAWQSQCGAVDADAAAERIYHQRLPPPENQRHFDLADELVHLRPYAEVFVWPKEGYELSEVAEGAFAASGSVLLQLVRDVPEIYEDDPQDAEVDWTNTIGAIMEELIDRSRTAGFLALNRLVLVDYGRVEREATTGKGEAQLAVLALEWSRL